QTVMLRGRRVLILAVTATRLTVEARGIDLDAITIPAALPPLTLPGSPTTPGSESDVPDDDVGDEISRPPTTCTRAGDIVTVTWRTEGDEPDPLAGVTSYARALNAPIEFGRVQFRTGIFVMVEWGGLFARGVYSRNRLGLMRHPDYGTVMQVGVVGRSSVGDSAEIRFLTSAPPVGSTAHIYWRTGSPATPPPLPGGLPDIGLYNYSEPTDGVPLTDEVRAEVNAFRAGTTVHRVIWGTAPTVMEATTTTLLIARGSANLAGPSPEAKVAITSDHPLITEAALRRFAGATITVRGYTITLGRLLSLTTAADGTVSAYWAADPIPAGFDCDDIDMTSPPRQAPPSVRIATDEQGMTPTASLPASDLPTVVWAFAANAAEYQVEQFDGTDPGLAPWQPWPAGTGQVRIPLADSRLRLLTVRVRNLLGAVAAANVRITR
ncbi:MAG: hypothetical protein OXF27_19995, partial [Acidobacteria bacterium]|nr:hypothetical protein [Acidobacteriota bacterium]